MDSGGNLPYDGSNTSPDGAITTTLGDYVVNVRSDRSLIHLFQEAQPRAPELLRLRHNLITADGRNVIFEFDYEDGTRSFPLIENGFISITKNGEELIGIAGTVTIEPVSADAVKVTLDQIAVAQYNVDASGETLGTPELIGSGVVEGPMRNACHRASDVVYTVDAGPTPAPLHDAAWIAQFCPPSPSAGSDLRP